jgi:hypothetical protein
VFRLDSVATPDGSSVATDLFIAFGGDIERISLPKNIKNESKIQVPTNKAANILSVREVKIFRTTSGLFVRTSPSSRNDKNRICTIPADTRIIELERNDDDDWIKIEVPTNCESRKLNDKLGWVYRDKLTQSR